MSKGDARTKKGEYLSKLETLLEEYPRILVVNVDNVGSNQMHQVRLAIRGEGVILMGKNTMVRKAMRNKLADIPALEKLMPFIRGNIGLVFTKGDLKELRTKLMANRVAAPARAGAIAPGSVVVPAGNTGQEPGKTSFFQALGIPTKIARGTIEIVSDINLIKTGDKVGPSEAALLNMLNISPFTYGVTVTLVYDNGTVFEPHILDIKDETLIDHLLSAIRNVACLSLAINFPTVASLPHILANAYKNLLAVAVTTDYSFEAADKIKAYLANPSAFAAAAPAAAAAAPAAAAKEAPKEAPKEESEEELGLDLFG